MFNVKELPATIEKITAYSENLKVFSLRLAGELAAQPGQFVMLSLPGLADRNGRRISRSYSIASAPNGSVVELCIARYPNGVISTPLFGKKAGDEVIITGPYGVFRLREPVKEGTVFLAGGTGLAPLRSMLSHLYANGTASRLWLFYSVSSPGLFLFKDELLSYAKGKGLNLVASTSSPDSSWEGENGRITETLPKHLQQLEQDGVKREEREFYICGPPLMVSDTVRMLIELGFRKENIHREQW